LRNLHLTFDWHYIGADAEVKMSQNSVAFSEYMNFIITSRVFVKTHFDTTREGEIQNGVREH
jgi:hypothetical protein